MVRIEDFSLEEVLSAAEFRSHFEVALVFSTKYEPVHSLLDHWKAWEDLKRRFFGFHRDLPPVAAAQILGGRVVYSEERKGQWVAVIEMEQSEILNAEGMSDAPAYGCIKWHECVLITSQTSRPGASCSESRAASVR